MLTHHLSRRPSRAADAIRGFTLIELLVVISVIAVLASMLLACITQVRSVAQSLKCGNTLRQVALAGEAYTSDCDGMLVPCKGVNTARAQWHFYLLTYLEQTRNAFDATDKRQFLRSCPGWIGSAYYTSTGQSASPWNVGYGYLLFGADPNTPAFPGPACLSQDYNGGMEPAVPSTLITRASERPLVADHPDFFLWTPWSTTTAKIDSCQRHRGKANVVYVDGHLARATFSDLVIAQQLR